MSISLKSKEFQVNQYITLKLEYNKTAIYINNEKFINCKYLLLNIPIDRIEDYENINSIDDIKENCDNSLEVNSPLQYDISSEMEFWGHCSNLQTWYENRYDTRLLHSNLAFPLLKKLTEVGDFSAKKVFKDEIAARFLNGSLQNKHFLYNEGYVDILTEYEFKCLLEAYVFQMESNKNLNLNTDEIIFFLAIGFKKLKNHIHNYIFNIFFNILKEKYYFEEFLLWYDIGMYCKAYNIPDIAIYAFLNSLKIDRRHFGVWLHFGILLKEESRYRLAIKTLKEALEILPNNIIVLNEIASSYHKISKYNEAINTYKKIIKFKSASLEVWFSLGKVYEEKGDFESALDSYMEAFKINPKEPNTLKFLINICRKLKDVEGIIMTCRYTLTFYPFLEPALNTLCEVLIENENFDETIELCKKALEKDPNNTNVLYYLRIAYTAIHQNDSILRTIFTEFLSIIKRLMPNLIFYLYITISNKIKNYLTNKFGK